MLCNWLAADCFVTYSPVSIKLINVFNFYFFPLEHFRHQNSWSISDSVLHAVLKASPVSLLNTRTTSLPWCVETIQLLRFSHATLRCAHKPLFARLPSGGNNTAGQSMECQSWHILSDLWNLQNVSNYSSAKTVAPIQHEICLICHLTCNNISPEQLYSSKNE